MRLAAGVERASEHPLALAIVEAATVRSLPVPDVTDFDSPVGRGVIGTVEGRVLVLGSSDFLNSHHIDTADLRDRADELRGDGATVIYMGADGWLVGLFAIADPIKATTPAALKTLREEGIRIVMLTGDNRVTAHAVAKTLGIDQDVPHRHGINHPRLKAGRRRELHTIAHLERMIEQQREA